MLALEKHKRVVSGNIFCFDFKPSLNLTYSYLQPVIVENITKDFKISSLLKRPTWKNEIKKCASGGDDDHTYTFELKTLDSIGLNYSDINRSTSVVAHGRMELYTKGTGLLKEPSIPLTDYSEENNYKIFSHLWVEWARLGWAYQEGRIGLSVKIHKDGFIELKNYVYAGSWGAVTCSESKAYVQKIEIIN
ncbi:hypothetical protein TSAR_003332 [Trichomalopsis sarcophagae]|uniref:Uncharacterized protein n=1 Tax=Trichomalopsis sarcophagae TaxID=543379 RepID=A0A232ERD7_9HYME|nr:hypothetical protein TSAR_003332 [Trichomalopsis sarcophagae]